MTKKEEIQEDLKKIKDIVILSETEGGKALKTGLLKDIVDCVDNFVDNRDKLTHQEFIALACDIKSKLDVLRVLTRAKKNEKFLMEELKATLQE